MTPYHSMEIYEDDESIAEVVAELFTQTRQMDQPCLLIARPAVNDRVRERLALSHTDMQDITSVSIVTIYSDIADLLIQRDNSIGAVGLEVLWNQIASDYAFTLACGYSAAGMRERIPTLADLERLCLEHNRVNAAKPASRSTPVTDPAASRGARRTG